MNATTKEQPSQATDLDARPVCQNALEDILRLGAQQLLQSAIETEVAEYVQRHQDELDDRKRRLVTRNGTLPPRSLQSAQGSIRIKQPRVRERREGHRFTSSILPPYLRRVASLDNLIPALYLRGVSTNQMQTALEAILGSNAPGLSAANVVRLKSEWETQRKQWQARSLEGKEYIYLWVDGIYFNVRLSTDRPCLLVIVGALADGTKELVGLYDGHRESKISWKEFLSDLKTRGLKQAPKVVVGDGALGLWGALEEEYPGVKHQRCWVHKAANVLDKMAKSVQPGAKEMLKEIYMSPSRKTAGEALAKFARVYKAKYPKAVACLEKGKEELLSFYDFPAEHWPHLRTTNPIESTFATVRHRTRQTKGCGSRQATLAMVYQLLRQTENGWRKLNGAKQLDKVLAGVLFVDGEEQPQKAA